MKNIFNVLIVGAGNIGAFYDNPSSNNILTHAHAFTKHKGFRLAGFIDIDKQKATKAAAIWNCRIFNNIDQAFYKNKVDVVVVATPDETHYQILKELSLQPLRIVLTEKPLTNKLKEGKEILSLYKKKHIPIVINYTRRFIPGLAKIKNNISRGLYGNFITGNSYYGKGLIHNGSHNIDLIRWFLGEINDAKILSSEVDYYHSDPSVSAILTLKNNDQLFLHHINCKLFTIFENNFFFSKGKISIKDNIIIEEYQVKKNQLFKGYKNLIKVKEIQINNWLAQSYLAQNIYDYFTKNVPLKCDINEGYKTLQACFQIKGEKWKN